MKKLIVVTGPTASGKSSLAIQLAKNYKSEIVSADSRQFFKGLDIGTAKPTTEELQSVNHHFVNSLTIDQKYNISQYEKDALVLIHNLFQKHDVLFLVGGSGLYIQAICNGLDDLPESDPSIRVELTEQYENEGIVFLQNKLQEVDPEYFSQVDINNKHRIIRALELIQLTGKKISELHSQKSRPRDFQIKKIGLLVDRDELYERINKRVDEMMKNGLLEEAKRFFPLRNEQALQTVGYKELFDHFENKISLETAVEKIKQNTRNYAKRQMTWFRRDPEIHWFMPNEIEEMKIFIEA